MFIGLLHLHSLLRWVVLVLMLVSIVKAFQGKSSGVAYNEKKLNMFTVLAFHIQVLIGVALYFMSDVVNMALHTEHLMKNAFARFWAIEHIFVMAVATILLTIGNAKAKRKTTDLEKHKTIFTFFIITLIIVIATIPWPFREAIGRNLFSFM